MDPADPVPAPLADLCDGDPLDLEADPRLRLERPAAPEPCGPLCTPWCLASHAEAGQIDSYLSL